MTVLADFVAGGRPRTKGSLSVHCMKNRSHTVRVEEDITESKAWRRRVARACREDQMERNDGEFLRWPGPVEVRLVFLFPREPGWPSHATEWPTHITLGDADKLARNVLDALSMPKRKDQAALCSALIEDDSQVVKLSVAKFWVPEGHEPGVQVLVMDVDEAEEERKAVQLANRFAKTRARGALL